MAVVIGNSGKNFIHRAGDGRTPPPGYDDITGVTAGDDVIFAREQDDILLGGGGNDRLVGGAGVDQMFGGPGNDTYYVDNPDDQVTEAVGDGFDRVLSHVDYTLAPGQEVEMLTPDADGVAPVEGTFAINLTGNEFGQEIWGNAATNTLNGQAGDDNLAGFDGDDFLLGGEGNDLLDGGDGNDTLTGGNGNDRLVGGSGIDTMSGNARDDTYIVDDAADLVFEEIGGGTDTVQSFVNYTLAPGQEIEKLTTAATDLTPEYGTIPINLTGNEFGQTIWGNNATNMLDGGAGDDTVMGFGGDDILIGGAGADLLDGGSGYNFASYATAAAGVIANLGDPSLNAGDAAGDQYWSHNIQGLLGSAYNDVLVSDGRQNEVVTLVGAFGDDILVDGGSISGGRVDMYGGPGSDTYLFNSAGPAGYSLDRVTEFAGDGLDQVVTSVNVRLDLTNAGQDIEVLQTDNIAGTNPLTLYGTESTHVIIGNAGRNDIELYSDARFVGNYTLRGGDGADVLSGAAGSAASNALDGGRGDDNLVGRDLAADAFVFDTPLDDAGYGGIYARSDVTNVDTVYGFNSLNRDQFVLDHNVFSALTPTLFLSSDAFHAASVGPSSGWQGASAANASDRIIYNTANGVLSYDADGTGPIAAVRFAVAFGQPTIAASDFTVI